MVVIVPGFNAHSAGGVVASLADIRRWIDARVPTACATPAADARRITHPHNARRMKEDVW
jgi:hypothetical protein